MFSTAAPAPPTQPLLTRAVEALHAVAQSLLTRLTAPQSTQPNPPPLPRPLARNPKTAAARITRTLAWLAALTHTIAGGRHYHRPTRITVNALLASINPSLFPPEPTPPSTPRRPRQPRTEPQREAARAAARLHYMRRVFATVPTATIATRLARRLGLTEQSPDWPTDLIDIAEPPTVWATRHHPQPEAMPSVGVIVRAARRLVAFAAREMILALEPHPLE